MKNDGHVYNPPQSYPAHQAPGGFEIREFLLLDRLPARADELHPSTDIRAPVIRLSPNYAEANHRSKAVPPREGRGGLAVRGYILRMPLEQCFF